MRSRIMFAIALLLPLALPGAARLPEFSGPPELAIDVLSSRPDEVTGGDARLRVRLPRGGRVRDLHIERGGADVTRAFTVERGGRSLTGVVTGLPTGWTAITARAQSRRALVLVRNRPTLSGPRQYPFVCKTDRNGLGQPAIDNQDREGMRVFAQDPNGKRHPKIVGWSRDCAAPPRVDYLYRTAAGQFRPLTGNPRDIAETTTLDGRVVPYVVRRERGTINRFVYSVATLVDHKAGRGPGTLPARWNQRLVYRFGGGIGIGHDQGVLPDGDALYHEALSLGYAVVASTGTQTGVHLNLRLGGETAQMVKEHFIERYGVPYYTVGTGGSGGGLQQYVYGQHRRGLLDAAIPQFAFADIATQIINIGDCELLERFADTSPQWRRHADRALFEGMAASNSLRGPGGRPVGGGTTCTKGWRGMTPTLFNPEHLPAQPEWAFMDPPGAMEKVRWTHWDDLRRLYGTDPDSGFARRTWDNKGVQYGLRALRRNQLTPGQFLELNARIGGWKPPEAMRAEACPYEPAGCHDQQRWDPWSARNATGKLKKRARPAPRSVGDRDAIRKAYETGQVFTGEIDIPVLDLRPYLDTLLDIHDSVQSFVARQRIASARGQADNHVIWAIDGRPFPTVDETGQALAVMDEWVRGIQAGRGMVAARPAEAVDRCSDPRGRLIAAGPGVWNGITDDRSEGACAQRFEVHSTPRIAAGQPYDAELFKCQKQPVPKAVDRGVYGWWLPTHEEQRQLKRIFPSGVCDYGRPGVGSPDQS